MRTTAIGLLIWLVIMLSEQVPGMEAPSPKGQPEDPSGSASRQSNSNPKEAESLSQASHALPALFCESAVKKAYKEGYRSGMQDSNQVIMALTEQHQRVFTHTLELKGKITEARNILDTVLHSVSPKTPHIAQLQDILILLNQALEPPSK